MKKTFLAIFCIALAAFFYLQRQDGSEAIYTPVVTLATQEPEQTQEYKPAIPLILASLDALQDTGYLKLVNREISINRPTDYMYIVSAWPTVPVRITDITLHKTALNAISSMFYEAKEIGSFFISSGHRSESLQRELYETAINRAYVLPPGHSEHQLGLAADILVIGMPMGQMSGTAEANWLAENAWRHGLILRYPYGTSHITGVAYEPWHFRYVGRIHAWYMTYNRMVLEEYLQHLEKAGGFSFLLNGIKYHVMYQQPTSGQIYVPQDLPFNISASNRGGYVITSWE